MSHHKILIVGGGAAGITVAASLRRKDADLDIAIIEPSEVHYYQPAFTLVGGGEYKLNSTVRPELGLIPQGVKWIKAAVASFEPEQEKVTLGCGTQISYDYLVVCPGLQLDWHKISGLTETLGKNNVCSNYSPETVAYTWDCIQRFKSGQTALFTQPPMPIKCAGAPQKIAYLTADRMRKRGILDKVNLHFYTAIGAMFGIPFFAKELAKVADSYGISKNFMCNLVAIDGDNKTATFEKTQGDNKETLTVNFDMIHVTPPQSAPDFIKQSPLANAAGWVEVDDNTMQHKRYPNIFSLGDACSTGNAKTAAAVRKQAPVVVKNIHNLMANQPLHGGYDGYGSCPLTTSLSTVLLAEFSYGGKVTPSFPFIDPRTGRYIWWLAKKIGLPWLYWDYMLKGIEFDIPHNEAYAQGFVNSEN